MSGRHGPYRVERDMIMDATASYGGAYMSPYAMKWAVGMMNMAYERGRSESGRGDLLAFVEKWRGIIDGGEPWADEFCAHADKLLAAAKAEGLK